MTTCKVQCHVARHCGTNKDKSEVEAGERGMVGIDGTGSEQERERMKTWEVFRKQEWEWKGKQEQFPLHCYCPSHSTLVFAKSST